MHNKYNNQWFVEWVISKIGIRQILGFTEYLGDIKLLMIQQFIDVSIGYIWSLNLNDMFVFSTVSSGLNAIVAVILIDIYKPIMERIRRDQQYQTNDANATLLAKILSKYE